MLFVSSIWKGQLGSHSLTSILWCNNFTFFLLRSTTTTPLLFPLQTPPTLPFTSLPLFPKYPLLTIAHKHNRYAFKSSSSSSHSIPTTATISYSFLEDPFWTGRFLSNEELKKLKLLEDFKYYQNWNLGHCRFGWWG